MKMECADSKYVYAPPFFNNMMAIEIAIKLTSTHVP